MDGFIAIAFFLFNILNIYFWLITSLGQWLRKSTATNIYYYLLRVINIQAAKDWSLLIGKILPNIVPVILIFIILAVRKQKVSSLGFRKCHNMKASIIGVAAGALIAVLMYCILFFYGNTNTFSNLSKLQFSFPALMTNLFGIGLTEEVCYRAFIQSRIVGIIRNQWAAVLTVGLMFWASHFFNNYLHGSATAGFFLVQGIFMTIMHIALLILYKKTDNILAPAFCHGIYDFMVAAAYL